MSRSCQETPSSAATRAITARASSQRGQPGRVSSVIRWAGRVWPGLPMTADAAARPRAVAGLAEPRVIEQVVAGVAEQVGDRGQRRHLGLLQAELDDVGREHERAAVRLEGDHVWLPLVLLVRGAVAVDLVE